MAKKNHVSNLYMSTQQVYVSGKTAQLQSLPQHPKDLTIKLHRRQEKTAAQRSYSQLGGGGAAISTRLPGNLFSLLMCSLVCTN